MRDKTARKSGSSILMVLLIISGVLVVVFAAQRISLVQFSQSSREEDNLTAYYAAKAGIEDGLARFRFNRNVETAIDKVFRFNLTNAKTPNTADTSYEVSKTEELANSFTESSNSYDPQQQYYDLQIMYRVNKNGFTGNAPDWTVAKKADKDTSITLSGFPNTVDPAAYYLRYAFKFLEPGTTNICTNTNAFVQLEQLQDGVAGTVLAQTQAKLGSVATGIIDSRSTGSNWLIKNGTNTAINVRFRPYFCDVQFAFVNSNSPSGVGKEAENIPTIDSLTTIVTSTGYYGSSKRTLVAEINRVSGTLLGIYDYNLYAGGGNVSR